MSPIKQRALDEAAAKEVERILRDAIVNNGSCGSRVVTLDGCTVEAVELACRAMRNSGYSFDGYVSGTDFLVSQKWDTTDVTVTNYRWMHAETQRYIDQIEAAILRGETEIVLQPGNYPDRSDKPWYYAADASRRVAAEGHTADGMSAGTDYVISRTGIRSDTNEFVVKVNYPEQEIQDETDLQPEPAAGQISAERETHAGTTVETREEAALETVFLRKYLCGIPQNHNNDPCLAPDPTLWRTISSIGWKKDI